MKRPQQFFSISSLTAVITMIAAAVFFLTPPSSFAQVDPAPPNTGGLPTGDIGSNIPDNISGPSGGEGRGQGALGQVAQGALEGSLTLSECEGGNFDVKSTLKGAAQGAINAGLSYLGDNNDGVVGTAASGALRGGGASNTSGSGIGSALGGAAGAIAGSFIAPGQGTKIGGSIGSSLGGLVGGMFGGGGGAKKPDKVVESSVRKKERCLDGLARMASNELLANLSDSTASWVKTGFEVFDQERNTSIVQNLDKHLTSLAYQEANKYLQNNDNFQDVCSTYQDDILLSLQRDFKAQQQAQGESQVPLIDSLPSVSGTCGLEDVMSASATEDYLAQGDFAQGGWEAWSEMTDDFSNSPLGSYLEKSREYQGQIRESQENRRDRLNQSGGFLSQRNDDGEVTTPGSVVSNIMDTVITSDVRRAELADEVDEAVTSFGSTAIGAIQGANTGDDGSPEGGFGETNGIIDNSDFGGDIEERIRKNFTERLERQLRIERSTLAGLKQATILADPSKAASAGITSTSSTSTEGLELARAQATETMISGLEQCVVNNNLGASADDPNAPENISNRLTVFDKTKSALQNTLRNRTKINWNGNKLEWVPLIAEEEASRIGWNGKEYNWRKDIIPSNWQDYDKNADERGPSAYGNTGTKFWYPYGQGWSCTASPHQKNRHRYMLILKGVEDPTEDAGGLLDNTPKAAETPSEAKALLEDLPVRTDNYWQMNCSNSNCDDLDNLEGANATSTSPTTDAFIDSAMINPNGADDDNEWINFTAKGNSSGPGVNSVDVKFWEVRTYSSSSTSSISSHTFTCSSSMCSVDVQADSSYSVCKSSDIDDCDASFEANAQLDADIALPDGGGRIELVSQSGDVVHTAFWNDEAATTSGEVVDFKMGDFDTDPSEDTDWYWAWNQNTCWEESKHEEWKGEAVFEDHGNEHDDDFYKDHPGKCNLSFDDSDDSPGCIAPAYRPPKILQGNTYQQKTDSIVESDCKTKNDIGTHWFVNQGEDVWRARECVARRSPQGPPVEWKQKETDIEEPVIDFVGASTKTDIPAYEYASSTATTSKDRYQQQQEIVSELCGLADKMNISTSTSEYIATNCDIDYSNPEPGEEPPASSVQSDYYDIQGEYILNSKETVTQIQERVQFYTQEAQDLNRTANKYNCSGNDATYKLGTSFGYEAATSSPEIENEEPTSTPSTIIDTFVGNYNQSANTYQLSWSSDADTCSGTTDLSATTTFDGTLSTTTGNMIINSGDNTVEFGLQCEKSGSSETQTIGECGWGSANTCD